MTRSFKEQFGVFLRFLFFYLRQREKAQAGREAEGEGEADSVLSREPNAGSIPGPQDHDLSQRQTLNWLSHPDAPEAPILSPTWVVSHPTASLQGKLCP